MNNTVIIGNRQFKAVPCSCRCGGNWAWVEVLGNVEEMIGCVCHYPLPLNDHRSYLS